MNTNAILQASLLLLLACGPQVPVDDGTTTGSAEDDGTAGGSPGSGPTTVSTTAATTATTTTATSTSTTTSAETTDDGPDDGPDGFIQPPDIPGPHPIQCDIWEEDCPDGMKCMPWANDGGSSWNSTKCVEIAPDPKQVGEPCTVEESGVSGIDDCDIHSMCWYVDPDTLMGECVAFCVGDEANPSCEDPNSYCALSGEGVLILCLPTCHPLEEPCPPDEVCVPGWGSELFCVFDASGDAGAAGDPCEFVNACNPGLFCASVDYVPDCEGNIGCCTPFCDLLAADPCPGAVPEVECIPWFEEGQAPPGYETLGVCGVPL